jgi:microcompartment protein CcmK/EutM
MRIAHGATDLGGFGECGPGASAPPGTVVGVAEREQHLATLGVPGARVRGQGRLVVRRRVGVGQRRGGLAGGGELPARQALAAGQRPGRAQVADDVAGAGLAGVGRSARTSAIRRCSRARRDAVNAKTIVSPTSAWANA